MEINYYYGEIDWDVRCVLHLFDGKKGSKVLNVGAAEEHLSNILADNGFDVTGIDLRPYKGEAVLPYRIEITINQDWEPRIQHQHKVFQNIPCRYRHIEGDFCESQKALGEFDAIVSTSAIEHFGLGDKNGVSPWYGKTVLNKLYDCVAMQGIWNCLKPGGAAYITVPYARDFLEVPPYYRVYDRKSLQDRIIGGFAVEKKLFFLSMPIDRMGNGGDEISERDADCYNGTPPHVTVFLKLRKEIQ